MVATSDGRSVPRCNGSGPKRSGSASSGPRPPTGSTIDVRFAFYGDLWRDDLEAERSDDITPIQDEVARELLARGGDAAVRDAADERSLFSTLAKLAGFVDEHVGIGGDIVLQLFLKDLAEYFRDKPRRAQANGVVAAEVKAAPGDVILMGHSMGTIVSYLSLFEEKAALKRVRGFLTFGSPLGMDSMQRHVGEIVAGLPFPDQPLRWVNVFNDEDFATMVPRLADIYRSTDGRVVEDVAALGKPPSVGDPGRGHDPLDLPQLARPCDPAQEPDRRRRCRRGTGRTALDRRGRGRGDGQRGRRSRRRRDGQRWRCRRPRARGVRR